QGFIDGRREMMTHWRKCIVCMVFAIGAPCAATAEEAAPAREVSSGETQQEAGLLLPAVQKVRSAQATSSSQAAPGQVQAAPQKGIEPDEIDRDNRAQNRSRARATRKLSTQQMMRKLKPQRATTKPPAGAG